MRVPRAGWWLAGLTLALQPIGLPAHAEPECLETLPPNTAVSSRLSVPQGEILDLYVSGNAPHAWSGMAGVWVYDAAGVLVHGRVLGVLNISEGSATIVEAPVAGTVVEERAEPPHEGGMGQLVRLEEPGEYTVVLAAAVDSLEGARTTVFIRGGGCDAPLARTQGTAFLYREQDFGGFGRLFVERPVVDDEAHAAVRTVVAGRRTGTIAERLFGWFAVSTDAGAARISVEGPPGFAPTGPFSSSRLFSNAPPGEYAFGLDMVGTSAWDMAWLFGADIAPAWAG